MDTVDMAKEDVLNTPELESDDLERRRARLKELWDSIDADLDSVPLKSWPEGDAIVEKFRRMVVLDAD